MDFIIKMGEVVLMLMAVALMLYYSAMALEDMNDTKEYVTQQNAQDAHAAAYSKVSAVDYRAVGVITKQEALDFIYTHVSDKSPVMLKLNNTTRYYFVSNNGGWNTNLPEEVGNNDIGSLETGQWDTVKATRMPSYNQLNSLLGGSTVKYAVDVDPLGTGDYGAVLVIRVN